MLERTDLYNQEFEAVNKTYEGFSDKEIEEQRSKLNDKYPKLFTEQYPNLHEEERVTSPTGGSKGQKLARYDLLPWDVLEEVAKHYGRGASKYEERNWERGYDWSLSYAALQRHLTAFWCGEDYDPESSSHHLDAVIFHAMALRRFAKVKRYKQYDNRPNIQGE